MDLEENITSEEVLDLVDSIEEHQEISDNPFPSDRITQGRNRYARFGLVVVEMMPKLSREIISHNIPPRTLFRQVDTARRNDPAKLDRFISHDERVSLNTLRSGTYEHLDFTTIYKLIRSFALVDKPAQGWGKQPMIRDTDIADDIERLRVRRNRIVHNLSTNISQTTFDEFFTDFTTVSKRVDQYLGKSTGTGFETEVHNYKTCPLDYELEQKYKQALQEIENMKYRFTEGRIHFHYGNTFERFIERVKTESAKSEKRQIIIIIIDDKDTEKKTRLLNDLKTEINTGQVRIEFDRAETGSLVLFIDVLENVISSDSFYSEVGNFIERILEFVNSPEKSKREMNVIMIQEDGNSAKDVLALLGKDDSLDNVRLLMHESIIQANALEAKEECAIAVLAKHRNQGFQWCREFLGGSWSDVEENDFIFTELRGGLTNLLYICELSDNIQTKPEETRKVLLRVYGDIAKDLKFLVQNSVVFCLLSEKHLGPKCYGLYPNGRIEEYIPTKCLQRTDLHNPEISKQIAKKLAVIHRLDMPLCKEPSFLKDLMGHWLAEITNNIQPDDTDPNIQKVASYNLEAELSWLLKKIENLKCPVVFSHNDLQEGNLLYFRECEDVEKQLTVIDLEYCSYNYRGFDFGNHFCEWCYDYQNVQEMPYFSYHEESYPTKKQQFMFFKEYLNGKSEPCTDEALEKLYKEATTCALASHLMWALWSIVQKDKSDIEFGYLEYAVCRLETYFKQKKALFPGE